MTATITFAPPPDADVLEVGERLLPPGFRLEVLSRAELLERLPEVEYLLTMGIGWLDDAALASAGKLKLIQLTSVGYDSFNVEGARKAGVPIAVNGGANAIAVAEHALMFMLALLRRLKELDASVHAGHWRGRSTPRIHEIWSQTVGIVGMGRIGQQVAQRLRPFEPSAIVYYDPMRLAAEGERALGVRYMALGDLLATADVVSLHVPLSPATHHLIDAVALARMKPSALLVNTSRGGLIDEAALAAALEAGSIAGAALDVLSQEPPPADHPLLGRPNLLLTPHMAGPTWESWPRRFENCFANIARVAAGGSPSWVIPELAELVGAGR